jgi:hypothetical protein
LASDEALTHYEAGQKSGRKELTKSGWKTGRNWGSHFLSDGFRGRIYSQFAHMKVRFGPGMKQKKYVAKK